MRILTFLVLSIGLCYQSFSAQFNYKVTCSDPSDCPEWFAGLIHKNGVCSSFLVRSNVMATNYHCLPAELTREGAYCENHIEFVFPPNASQPEERIECDRVLYLSPPLGKEVIKPDFAFIRLKTTPSRRPAELAQSGFPDESKVTMYKMDPSANSNFGTVRRVECKAIQNSVINPYFINNTAPLVLLTDCTIIKGNSGSPLIVDGEVRGVVSATMELMTPSVLQNQVGRRPKLSFGFGSNFSCLSNHDLGLFMDKIVECEIPIDTTTQKKRADALIKKALDKALNELQEKVNNSSQKDLLAGKPLLLWKALDSKPTSPQDDYLIKINFHPYCLLPKTSDISPFAKRLSAKQVSMPQVVPEYLVSEKLDEYLRYYVKLRETKKSIPLTLVPRDLVRKKNIPIQFNESPMTLDLCSEVARNLQQ